MEETTLVYLTYGDQVLMLHRVKKEHDINAGKWIGVGGHLEIGETPEMCARREVFEETGLLVQKLNIRGVVDFYSGKDMGEHMYLYTAEVGTDTLSECDEGVLQWFHKDEILSLNLWEGDRIFLRYLREDRPVFHLSLHYEGDRLVRSKLYPRVILASQSPRRRELLHQVGIFPEIMPSGAEEKTNYSNPSDIVMDLSSQKAMSIAREIEKAAVRNIPSDNTEQFLEKTLSAEENALADPFYVVGSDTIVYSRDKVLGKPQSHEEAYQMIRSLSRNVHQVYTGVTILRGIRSENGLHWDRTSFFEAASVHVAPMTEEEIRAYTDSAEPMDKAGAYGIQGPFAAYVESIMGDYTTIVGLPVSHTVRVLKEMGYPYP
ncbi:MAG: Maf family nucleotide pyrophosphatase [Lachnospiraceae bacterium]|nr:Maf family nucleotide pyrophosphatase [Lachnospiraceae bacterium]